MAECEHRDVDTTCTTVTSVPSTTITTSTDCSSRNTISTTAASSITTTTTAATASEANKRRFNLREALGEVKALMEGSGESGEGISWEERCMGLHRHHQALAREYKRIEKRLVECQRKQLEIAQHRDVIQTEYARVNVAKGKLENLCRELQKHSKAVAEESKQRQRDDEERRKEVSAKFQSTINDITLKMQEHHQHNQALRQENLELITKLKQITEQYEAREEHYEKLLKHKQLELQLSEAKMAQQMVAAAEEKENSLAERQYLLVETLEQQKRCEMLTKQESELRGQLSLYSDKFEEFQQTLTRSNQVFSTFKRDTDKMSKTISALEKEVGLWKARYEKASKMLADTTEEKGVAERNVKTLRSKTEKLERLCRAMQGERNQLRDEIKNLQEAQPTSSKIAKPDVESRQNDCTSPTSADTSSAGNTGSSDKVQSPGDSAESGKNTKEDCSLLMQSNTQVGGEVGVAKENSHPAQEACGPDSNNDKC